MNKQEYEALRLCVASLYQLLPYLAKVPADVGLLNSALMAARPLLKEAPVEPAPQWQVRYLPGEKVPDRWWQDSSAERAAWCADTNAQQLAEGLPDIWEIRKFYTASISHAGCMTSFGK